MKKFSIFICLLLILFNLTACSDKGPNNSNNIQKQKAVNLRSINKVLLSYGTAHDLGDTTIHPGYEIYSITNSDTIAALQVSIKNLTKTTGDPESITYHATFLQSVGRPVDMWFGFPDKVWMKNPDGKMECWAVDGEFANLIARELQNVPIKYKGEVGINSDTRKPVLFVFDKPYNLYMAPVDATKVNTLLAQTALVVGMPFVKNNEDYIQLVHAESLPSKKFTGELKLWLTGDLAIQTNDGQIYILRLTNAQKNNLKTNIGKQVEIRGILHEANNDYAKQNIEIYYYKFK